MNLQQIMAQAQRMQKDLSQKKSEIDAMKFTGKSDWIEMDFMGNREIVAVRIMNDDAFDVNNKEILSDMIFLAVKDAMQKIDSTVNDKMGAYSQMNGLF